MMPVMISWCDEVIELSRSEKAVTDRSRSVNASLRIGDYEYTPPECVSKFHVGKMRRCCQGQAKVPSMSIYKGGCEEHIAKNMAVESSDPVGREGASRLPEPKENLQHVQSATIDGGK